MGATVNVNKRTVVHKDSGGQAVTVPDFCKTPSPPVPVPYINVSRSADTADGSVTVKMDGNPIMLKGSKFSTSTGDEAGVLKGVASNTIKGIAKFTNYSFDVKVEGKNVPRLGDPMTGNGNGPNTVTVAEVQSALGIGPVNITDMELRMLCSELCSAYQYEDTKSGIAGGRRVFTKKVMQRLEPMRGKVNMRLEKCFQTRFGRCFPDVTLMTPQGTPRQVVDFKFPGDRVRRRQMLRWRQVAPPTDPIMLNDKVCECNQ